MAQIAIGSLPPAPALTGSATPLATDLMVGVDITDTADGVTKKYTRASAFNFELNALGFTTYIAVGAATTTALTATYDNGVLGSGATLTNAGAQAVLSIDGVTAIAGARVLIKNQTSTFQNGIYTVSNIGSASTNWVLIRATDYDQAADVIQYGVMLVAAGTTNKSLLFQETGAGPFIMGTTAITFAAFQAGQISLPVSLANGGTGASLTASNGGIFYSNASAGALLAGTATARQMLQSGASGAPAWSTATWPATTSVSQLLYSSTSNVVTGLATVQGGTLTTNAALAPAWVANPSATGRYLRSVSGDSAAWSTASIADTFAVSTILYASSLNTVSGLVTANNGLVITNGTGVPSITNTLNNDFRFENQFSQNLIIGGDFGTNPWQRGTSFVSPVTTDYSADQFKIKFVSTGVVTITKDTDAPTIAESVIFTQASLKIDVTTADAAIAAGDYFALIQPIEGYSFADIAQREFILSFWVKAVKTGIYCVAFSNSGLDRSYVSEYTIDTTNTWEFKTIAVPASPTAGTWDYTNGVGLNVNFTLAAGTTFQTTADAWQTGDFLGTANQVNGLDSAANNFFIDLVQIEHGSLATPFSQPSVGVILSSCQRYYQKTFPQGVDPAQATGSSLGSIRYIAQTAGVKTNGAQWQFTTTMRASPAMTYYSPIAASSDWYNLTGAAPSGVSSSADAGPAYNNVLISNPQVAGDGVGNIIGIHAVANASL